MRPPTAPTAPRAASRATSRAAGWALAVLTLVNLLNYVDRFVVAAVAESLKRSELAPSDAELGLLATGFIVVYAAASPLFGALGDRGRRPRLLGAGVFLWSLFTALGGAARSLGALFTARAAVGVGEAAYGTISPGLIADLYPPERRGRALAIFFAAIPVGSALGYVLGGLVDHALGWRAAFLVAGAPGLLLAGLCLRVPDPPRGFLDPATPAGQASPPGNSAPGFLALLGNRRYRLTVLGYAAYTFAVGGMGFWMPAFLERVRGVPRAQATVELGAVVVLTGFAGTMLGGWLGDLAAKRLANGHLWLSGVTTLAAFPFAWLALASDRPALYLPALVVAQLLLFASTGPVNAVIVDAVAPGQRARAMALSILAIHALGDVPSPPLVGWLSDRASLASAVLVMPAAVLVAGLVWTWAATRRWGSSR